MSSSDPTASPSIRSQTRSPLPVIGLLPAAGQATRIAPLPLSKELYPIGFQAMASGLGLRPKVVSQYLLERLQQAGITQTYFILRPGKWDIPAYFGDGSALPMHLGYLIMGLPYGVPYTLDQAYPFVQNAIVALGFPDILFWPEDAFTHLLQRQAQTQADVVLGLFPTDQPQKAGMVDFDATGRVHLIIEKPSQTELKYMWAIAVWNPTFTQFLHEHLIAIEAAQTSTPERSRPSRELAIGDVIQAGISAGLRVEAEIFETGVYLDIGTPENLVKAVQDYARLESQAEPSTESS
uniref:nucleotidyltransferase family protein n=1 Tax=Trichocoleus desertorum TaxID=1481672 RepID=UPI0025B49773|nr:sugar phosphate nucleotidyltransferase [Trichocoleus desertorum]